MSMEVHIALQRGGHDVKELSVGHAGLDAAADTCPRADGY